MFYVYILQSVNFSEHFYVGSANDLRRRLKEHIEAKFVHTSEFKPCGLRGYTVFGSEDKAQSF